MAGALAAFDEASQELFLPLTTVQVPEAKTHMGGHGAHNGAAAPRLSLIHISEPTRLLGLSRMPSSA